MGRRMRFILIAAALLTAFAYFAWGRDQIAYARIATAYAAKSICSCRVVAERPMDSCMTDFTVDTSPFAVEETRVDGRAAVTVAVLGGMIASRAEQGPGGGCFVAD